MRSPWKLLAIASLALNSLAVLLLGVFIVGNLVHGNSDSPSGPKVSKAPTLTAHGTFELHDSDTARNGCEGTGGYSDIGSGAQVKIIVESQVVGFSDLGTGIPDGGTCTWTFTIPNIPAGKSVYEVEVGKRGAIDETQTSLSNIGITLGSN